MADWFSSNTDSLHVFPSFLTKPSSDLLRSTQVFYFARIAYLYLLFSVFQLNPRTWLRWSRPRKRLRVKTNSNRYSWRRNCAAKLQTSLRWNILAGVLQLHKQLNTIAESLLTLHCLHSLVNKMEQFRICIFSFGEKRESAILRLHSLFPELWN